MTLATFGAVGFGQVLAASSAVPGITAFDVGTVEGGPLGDDHLVSVKVELSVPSTDVATVEWKTVDGTAIGGQKDSSPLADYRSDAGVLTFASGQTSATIDILIYGGAGVEPDEAFTVVLSNPVNATVTRAISTVTIFNDDFPDAPVAGEVNVIPVEGGGQCVAVKGGAGCEPLVVGEQIEIEDVLYVNPGRSKVSVQSIAGIGTFYGGRFDVKEIGADGPKPILVMRLVGGNLAKKCGTATRTTAGLNAQAKKTPVRRLWGKGKGRFRTRGRYSSGTVRGTNWVTTDFCGGTNTRVVAGIVQVYDLVLKKLILLNKGQSYFANAGKIK